MVSAQLELTLRLTLLNASLVSQAICATVAPTELIQLQSAHTLVNLVPRDTIVWQDRQKQPSVRLVPITTSWLELVPNLAFFAMKIVSMILLAKKVAVLVVHMQQLSKDQRPVHAEEDLEFSREQIALADAEVDTTLSILVVNLLVLTVDRRTVLH